MRTIDARAFDEAAERDRNALVVDPVHRRIRGGRTGSRGLGIEARLQSRKLAL